MQITGTNHAPYADCRFSALRVVFGLVDVTAAGDATISVSEKNACAVPSQTINGEKGMGERYATVEQDQFLLDGTFHLFPDDPAKHQVGWWSAAQSNKEGMFASPPVLTFIFTQPHSSMGFTVVFDDQTDQYCTDFTVQTYDAAGKRITYEAVTGNTLAHCPVELFTDKYRKVVFTFQKTNHPQRYVRVSQVLFGVLQRKDNSNTASAELLYEISPTMESAPANEFVITFQNTDRRYNMINPGGIYRFLQQGQRLDVELATGDAADAPAYVNMGCFYFSSSEAEDSGMTAKITAHSPLYAMDKTKFRKGRLENSTVKAFIAEVFADAGFSMTVRDLGGVGSRMISAATEVVSHREAVRQAAQAARCICVVTREDEVVLTLPQIGKPTDTLSLNEQVNVPAIKRPDRVNTVAVSTRRLTKGTADPHEIHKSTVAVNGTQTQWFDYQGAAFNVSASVSSGTLVRAEYYLYAARLTLSGSGNVTVTMTGTAYDGNDATATAQRLEGNDTAQPKEIRNPLIATGFEQQTAEWLLSLYYERFAYHVTERGNPAREVGDSVRVYDAYGEHRAALATKLRLKFDGTLSGTMEAYGQRE